MGTYRIEIQAVGGHGCQRDIEPGVLLKEFCGNENCPDCLARKFVADLKKHNNVQQALLIHWPENRTIVDNLLDSKRTGSFRS